MVLCCEITINTKKLFNEATICVNDGFDSRPEARACSDHVVTTQILHRCPDGLPQGVQTVMGLLVTNSLSYYAQTK